MAKSRASKEQSMSTVRDMLVDAKGVVLADFTGLTVKDMQALRRELRKEGLSYEAVKKTVFVKALNEVGMPEAVDMKAINGSLSVAVSKTDEVAAARAVSAFAKTHDKLKILGGILEKSFIATAKVKNLANLPSKQQLLGQVVGTIQAPVSGFVRVLQGNLRGLVYALKAIQEKKS